LVKRISADVVIGNLIEVAFEYDGPKPVAGPILMRPDVYVAWRDSLMVNPSLSAKPKTVLAESDALRAINIPLPRLTEWGSE